MENPSGEDGKQICSFCGEIKVLNEIGACAECHIKLSQYASGGHVREDFKSEDGQVVTVYQDPKNPVVGVTVNDKAFRPVKAQTCETCKWWNPEPLPNTRPDIKEHICRRSQITDSGVYGQDGKAVITHRTFGCNQHETK